MIGPRFRQGSCRLCLWESNSLWDIFGELAERRNFARKIEACVNIIVSKDDGLSSLICPNCIYKIELFYDFQTSCKRSDEIQKRYNEFQDVGHTDRDAVEDVIPATALHCTISNSHKDAQCPVETIDIKEEPLDDDEATADGMNDDQFEDAEVEIEEVQAVAQDSADDGVVVAQQQIENKDRERDKQKDGEAGGNGSCLQLTPPRSPSVTSEVTYSASEAGGSAERHSPEEEEQQQQEEEQDDDEDEDDKEEEEQVGLEGPGAGLSRKGVDSGRSCTHCAKWHPDPSTCWEHERSCLRRGGAEHQHQQQQQQQQEEEEEAVVPRTPPPATYPNRCRFCKKWYQKAGICRVHEMVCGPMHGYKAPELPSGRGVSTRCRFCAALFVSKAGRHIHEYHCFRREHQIQSGELSAAVAPHSQHAPLRKLPPPPKYCNQCRFCRKYFPRVPKRRIHEAQCGRRLGYTPPSQTPPNPLPMDADGEKKCSHCGKQLKTLAGRYSHEYHCRRSSLPTRHNLASNQCRYCHTRFLSRTQRLSHELSCAEASGWLDGPKVNAASRAGGQDAVKCRYCGKGHLKWRSLLTHEFHCRRKAPLRAEADVEVLAAAAPAQLAAAAPAQLAAAAPAQLAAPAPAELAPAPAELAAAPAEVETPAEVVTATAPVDVTVAPAEVAVAKVQVQADAPVGIGGDKDESGIHADSTASEDMKQGSLNRCSYCYKLCKTKQTRKVHESCCSRNVRMTIRGRYMCSYCPRSFQRRSSLIMHERHCPHATGRTGDSGTVGRAVTSVVAEIGEQQSGSTTCDMPLSHVGSIDQQEIASPVVPESERKRKKMDSPLCLPVVDSTKETDVWKCRYCDRAFKYRECLRTHEVKCSAIATYQYSTPSYRQPSFFTCPLCRKAFKFRRKLHNHWKVCRARTSVVAEAAEVNCSMKPAWARPERLDESTGCEGVMPRFGSVSSPGEDREEWRGWPSSHSPTVVAPFSDEDSSYSVADSSGLSCKLCHKDFCSRVLLELHTLNECVYQRIRNDHAYAQCESPGVDESTLMRLARVELQRLLLCSCCGRIFRDRQALADHELGERQRHDSVLTEAENRTQVVPEAIRLQKRIKLETEVGESGLQLESRGQQESSCRSEQLTANYRAVPTTYKRENTDSGQESSKKCVLQDILMGADCQQFPQKVSSEKQVYSEDRKLKMEVKKEEVDCQQPGRRQLESADGEQGSGNNSVVQVLVRNNADCSQEQFKDNPGKKVSLADGVEQGSQMEIVQSQYQERPSETYKRQLQDELPDLAHLLQQQLLEDPKNRQSYHNCSEEHRGERSALDK